MHGAAAGKPLSTGQREAIRQAADAPVLVLTGGPGCGKTFATATIVKLWRAMSGKRARISLCAPTGAHVSLYAPTGARISLRAPTAALPLTASRLATLHPASVDDVKPAGAARS